jgi:ferredoxin-NADP reductase
MQLMYERCEQLSAEICTFWFRPDHKPDYMAGQFIEISLPHSADKRGERRWFTLSSSPRDELISVTTRLSAEPSSFKKLLRTLEPGDVIHASQPMGDFVLPRDRTIPLLFVAVGIGITPIKSILSYLEASSEKRTMHILYAAKSEEELIYKDMVTRMDQNARFYIQNPKEATAMSRKISSQDIFQAATGIGNPYIYLSGPEEAVEELFTELREAGIKNSRLVTDYFQGYGQL